MSGGRHACMESLVHQMAAQSVGHMDEGRPRTGGGQWFAHLVSATVAFSSGSCANGTPWARTISLVGRWTLRSRKGRAFMWPEAVPQQSTAHDDLECSGHGRTGANRPPRRRQDFHLEHHPITVARPESLA